MSVVSTKWERRAKLLTKKINGKEIKEVAENLPSMVSKEISKQGFSKRLVDKKFPKEKGFVSKR